jgi:hypothetical protein
MIGLEERAVEVEGEKLPQRGIGDCGLRIVDCGGSWRLKDDCLCLREL